MTRSAAGGKGKALHPPGTLADADFRTTIEERLDLNILVEAGAGSGKTHSLANRMAAGIVCGKYEVQHLAAVTFTRKAAAELRARFQLALEQRLPKSRGDERARIERALANLEHLFAGTIHSFCAHLLRERPVEANVAPGFTELDELDDAEAREGAWRDYLSKLRGESAPLLHDLQRARVSARDLDGAFRTLCMYDEVDFAPGNAAEPDLAAARKATDAFWKKLRALMPKVVDPGHKCDALDRALEFERELRAAGRSERPADLAQALRCWESTPKVTMKWWAQEKARQLEVREKVEALVAAFQAETVIPFLTRWREYVYRLAMTLLAGARDFTRDQRRRALALNYGDLLSAAAALLRTHAAVRRALRQKYQWLFVDEFQDTDPIQAEVILLLSAEEGEAGGANSRSGAGTAAPLDPYKVHLRPGALFVVGDPKQSIYRFRRADIDVYNCVRDTIKKSGGLIVPLTTSFRARPSLCEWNNLVFGQLLPAESTVHQAAFGPLDPDPGWTGKAGTDRVGVGRADSRLDCGSPRPEPGRGAPSRPNPRREAKDERGLRTLTAPSAAAKGRSAAAQVAAWEAGAIARYIRAEIDAGRAAAEDVLILTRKKKRLGVYAAALQAQGIAVEVAGAGAFGGSAVAQALVQLLRALGDPGDALTAVGVLRGPLFGMSDRQLFEHRRAGGYFTISAAKREPDDRGKATSATDEALRRLGDYLHLTRTLPLPAAVERIIEDSGFLAIASAEGAGAGCAGDLLHAVDLVREAAEEGASLAEAADALEQAAESTEIESVPLEPGQRSVVRVMNLHKAKGLEGRVVFLADPLGGPKKSADVRIVRRGASAHGYLAISKKIGEYGSELIGQPAGWDDHQAAEMAYVLAEERRLLYVAATRARELLVICQCDKGEDDGQPWGALSAHLDDVPELAVPEEKPGSAHEMVDLSAKARARAAEARDARRTAACEVSWAVTSPTAEGLASARDAGAAAPRRRDSTDHAPADAGPAWGSLVHGLLEYAGRHPTARLEDFERLGRWLVVDAPELSAHVPDAVALVQRVIQAPFWKEVRAGGHVLVEVPFAVRLEPGESLGGLAGSGLPTVVQGVIDLVHQSGEGWRILDYKTDRAAEDDAALAARHAPQLAAYRAAWERVTGEKVTGTAIVALRTLKTVPV